MGWHAGNEIFDRVIQILNDHIDNNELREAIYIELIPLFEDHDCDSLSKLLERDDAFDSAFKYICEEKGLEDGSIYSMLDDDD